MKIEFPKNKRLVNLLQEVELSVFLIMQELKNLKFINELDKADVDASAGILDFSPLILAIMDLGDNLSDEFHEWYYNRQEELSSSLDPGNEKLLLERAFGFYADLVVKKHEMNRGINGNS